MKTTIVTLLTLLTANSALSSELISLKDYLKKELSGSAKMTKESFPLAPADKAAFSSLAPDSTDESFTFYFGKSAEGKIEKSCTVVPQKGKEGPLTIGVCFTPDNAIQTVTILAHMEERGKGISERSFLKQFDGKRVSDSFQLGKDVDGISGATWSSKAIAEAVRKSSFAYSKFIGAKK